MKTMHEERPAVVEQPMEWAAHAYSPDIFPPLAPLTAIVARDPGAAAYGGAVAEAFVRRGKPFAVLTAEKGQKLASVPGLQPMNELPRVSIALVPGDHDPAQAIVPLLQKLKTRNSRLKIAVAEDYPRSTDRLLSVMASHNLLPQAIFSNSKYTENHALAFLLNHGLSPEEVPYAAVSNPAFDEHYLTPPVGTVRERLKISRDTFLLGIFGMPEQDIPSPNGGLDHNSLMMQTIREWLLARRAPMAVLYRAHGRSGVSVHPALQNLPEAISVYQFPDAEWKSMGIETPSVWPDCSAVVMGRSTLGQEIALVRDRHTETLPVPIEAILEDDMGPIQHDALLARFGAIRHASSAAQLYLLLSEVRRNVKHADAQMRSNHGVFSTKMGWTHESVPYIAGTLERLRD